MSCKDSSPASAIIAACNNFSSSISCKKVWAMRAGASPALTEHNSTASPIIASMNKTLRANGACAELYRGLQNFKFLMRGPSTAFSSRSWHGNHTHLVSRVCAEICSV